ncbi:hypothetical protein MMC26_003004 [Xylographa opegraphella]|nr:hypothetical protein [Xylographa opegraphella]
MATTPPKTYCGNCHCAAFKFSLTVPKITSVQTCNCSICSKKGYLWVYPRKEAFTIERGEDALAEYHSASKAFTHKFCPTCGTPVMAVGMINGTEMIAVNVRTLRDFDVWAVDPYPNPNPPINGAAFGDPYVPPKNPGPDIRTEAEKQELKLYTGNCHCGAVIVALKSKPISEVEVNEDDCSICVRNANILIYPQNTQIAIHGGEHLTGYVFGKRTYEHKFCSICGVSVCLKPLDISEEVTKDWPLEKREELMERLKTTTINIRILQDVDVRDVKQVKIIRDNEMSQVPPPYTVD